MPVKSAEVIGFKKEVTYGTFTAPTSFVPGSAVMNSTTKVARPEQSRGNRDFVIDAIVGVEVGATLTCQLIPEVISQLFFGWLGIGSDTVSGSGAVGFTHKGVPKNTVPSFSFEIDHDVTSQVLARQIVGANVDQCTIRGTQQAIAECDFTLIGQREITPTTPGLPSNPTPSFNTQQPLDHSRLTASYKKVELGKTVVLNESGASGLQDFTLTLMNHVQRVFSSNKQLYVVRLVPTRREIQFQTTLDFMDTTFYNDWLAGTQTTESEAFKLQYETAYKIEGSTGESHKNIISFSLPRLRPMGAFNLQDASDVLNQQLTWSVVINETEKAVLTTEWQNGESGALA